MRPAVIGDLVCPAPAIASSWFVEILNCQVPRPLRLIAVSRTGCSTIDRLADGT